MTDKAWLISKVQKMRETFDHSIASKQIDDPIAPGGMTIKEVIYHVAWYENQMVDLLRSRVLAGSPWWNLPTDERNALIQVEAGSLGVGEVINYAGDTFNNLVHALEELPMEALDKPSFFENMPADWSVAELLRQNTYQHYEDHLHSG